ncbi:MAG: CNNM domain-containing protein [Bradymonadia bacterium]
MGLLIFYVMLALGVSFMCSVMEAVLLSLTGPYITALEGENNPAAPRLKAFKTDVDRPLAAILSLNTVAHTVGAAGAGAQAQVVFGETWIAVSSAVLTLLILVVSEIIPKTIGAVYWRGLAPKIAPMLAGVIWITWPLVKMSEIITKAIAKGEGHGHMSREEFEALADVGRQQGLIDEAESKTLKNLLKFGTLKVRDAMTPRTVMISVRASQSVGEILTEHPDLRFTRLPILGDRPDDIQGYVLKTDLLLAAAKDEHDTAVTELKRSIHLVDEDARLWDVFQHLLKIREQVAVAVDQYGGVEGIITLEDLVETLLGMEIVDEVDNVQDMQALARERWRQRAERLGILQIGESLKPETDS